MPAPLPSALHRQTLADLLHRTAARWPHKTGIVCGDVRWTWAQFDTRVDRVAAGLHAAGVAPGDRVGVLARNSHGFALLRFALARLGAVLVPVNFMLNADEAAYVEVSLEIIDAKAALDHALADLERAPAWKRGLVFLKLGGADE